MAGSNVAKSHQRKNVPVVTIIRGARSESGAAASVPTFQPNPREAYEALLRSLSQATRIAGTFARLAMIDEMPNDQKQTAQRSDHRRPPMACLA